MPNRQLYDRIERLTKQTLLQLHELEQISEELQKVIEENHNLTMENRSLERSFRRVRAKHAHEESG